MIDHNKKEICVNKSDEEIKNIANFTALSQEEARDFLSNLAITKHIKLYANLIDCHLDNSKYLSNAFFMEQVLTERIVNLLKKSIKNRIKSENGSKHPLLWLEKISGL